MGGPVKKFPADSVLGGGALARYAATLLAVALAYFVLAKLGLMLGRGRRGELRRSAMR
jgi:hypothetical protein